MASVIKTVIVKEASSGTNIRSTDVSVGIKGDPGPIGPQGPTGLQGPMGPFREIKVETITLTSEHITNKKFSLSNVPQEPSKLEFIPVGGIPQVYGVDYVCQNDEVSWNGLGLDGFLELNEQVIVRY